MTAYHILYALYLLNKENLLVPGERPKIFVEAKVLNYFALDLETLYDMTLYNFLGCEYIPLIGKNINDDVIEVQYRKGSKYITLSENLPEWLVRR